MRLGNYLLFSENDKLAVVIGICTYGIDVKIEDEEEEVWIESHAFEPIPLTEEWLLKFGFEVFKFDNDKENQYRFGNRLIVKRDGVFTDYGTSVSLKYVHILQNLYYFALTNKELILK